MNSTAESSHFSVFYSWQSDLASAENRLFIHEALELACKQISSDPEVDASASVDQDTAGVPGTPKMISAILAKIDRCDAFVADVSFVFERHSVQGSLARDSSAPKRAKKGINSNVSFEAGYAVAKLGWEKIIFVLNNSTGGFQDLPFDLEKHRIVAYCYSGDQESERSRLVAKLANDLAREIGVIARQRTAISAASRSEEAILALRQESVDSSLKVRDYLESFLLKLANAHPQTFDPQEFVDRLQSTIPLTEEFSRVVQVAVVTESNKAIRECWKFFEKLLQKYDTPVGSNRVPREEEFDWWKFHGRELLLIFVGHMMEHRQYPLLRELLDERFVQNFWAATRGSGSATYRDLWAEPILLSLWYKSSSHSYTRSPLGDQLFTRNSEGSGRALAGASIFEADMLLSLHSEKYRDKDDVSYWGNSTHIYLSKPPAWLTRLSSRPRPEEIMQFFDFRDSSDFRAFLTTWWDRQTNYWRRKDARRVSTPVEEIEKIPNIVI